MGKVDRFMSLGLGLRDKERRERCRGGLRCDRAACPGHFRVGEEYGSGEEGLTVQQTFSFGGPPGQTLPIKEAVLRQRLR